ncbi:MAG: bifunctional demethylmenaquinone methyltransferase/2-methoxy-6-polyprenyl-1,4-benzoquinol methylase UbiE [Armatimonadetes bacterium]|nr:bifunctional demethylmenaquinone methyltransferase/2-methoxy-6-polyprenyl-1,4-benzoquinol methylase UbiE [Armatimonadota bacterium]
MMASDQAIWHTEGSEKRQAVQRMFGEIAPSYDLMNSVMSVRLHHKWRRLAVQTLQLTPGERVLDLCCGTGDFLAPLREAVGTEGTVIGADFCLPMLDKAATKFKSERLAQADACQIPMQSGVVDAVTVGWGIRNVPDIDLAHREIARVLRPGGRFVSIDMAVPKSGFMRWQSNLVFHRVVPFIGRLIGKGEAYKYLPKSTERFKSREELKASMEAAGFRDVRMKDLFFGNVCMHWGVKS